MPSYIVTLKNGDASDEDVAAAKKHCTEKGGKIGHEYDLIKGFSVSFDEDVYTTLSANEKINVEQDAEMKTQG